MKNRNIIFVSIAIILAIFIGFAISQGRDTDTKTIKIGAILPLTGTQAFAGEGMKNALEMALHDLPNTKYKYELVIANNAFDVKSSISAAQKLIDVDKVSAIIDAYAPIGNAVSPITEKAHIVHIGVAFDPKIAEGDYNFLLFTTPDTAARAFLAEMQKRGLHTLGIFRVNNQGIFAVYSSLESLANQYGVTIVSDQMFQPGERDFKSLIAKSAPSKPDLYALLALSPELEILTRQLQDQGIHDISSTIYFELAKDKSVFEGLWSVGYGEISPDFVAKYKAKYKAKYNQDITFGVPNVYDAFNILVQSAESYSGPGKPSSEFIAKQIQRVGDFQGVLGKLHVDSAGIIDTPTSIKIVKDGVLVGV